MLALHENALVAKLRAHRLVKAKVRTTDSLPKLFGEKLLKQYVVDAPALYVVPGRIRVSDDQAVMEFVVAGVIRNVAGQDKARKGDGIDIGCDHLLRFAIKALNRQVVGDASWVLASAEMADDELFESAGISAIEMKFVSSGLELEPDYTEDELNTLPVDSDIGDFKLFHADIDSPADAGAIEYASWLLEPPDYTHSQPDLQMDVQLPGAST